MLPSMNAYERLRVLAIYFEHILLTTDISRPSLYEGGNLS